MPAAYWTDGAGPRIAVVGCGRRFQTAMLPVLLETGSPVVAVVDSDRRTGESVAEAVERSHPIISDHLTPQILQQSGAEAVLIASPSALHFEQINLSLTSGLMTFSEKPIADKSVHALALRGKSRGRLTISEQRTYRKDLISIREYIQGGVIGDLRRISYRDTIKPAVNFAQSWRNDPALSGGGVLFDLGYHTIHTIQWLLDFQGLDCFPREVRLRCGGLNVEKWAHVLFALSDVEVDIAVGLVLRVPQEVLRIHGTFGELRMLRRRSQAVDFSVVAGVVRGRRLEEKYYHTKSHDEISLRAFLNGILSDRALDGHVSTVQALESFYQRARRLPDAPTRGLPGERIHSQGSRAFGLDSS